ncbi:isocitrate dehydrogenase, alpha subunit [Moesziomyces antarcticus T-34]|uniref:Isocitrate dehydrogenase, alpha subunit n=1 Tax=Pseudozyma antarctica (strain T-34) TaxID=1151754 RepID=M9LSN6_PSEA3|nr:isocitrate dehydrogenase, alpha subunit [Moesziomyces antarcticus T-34]
MSNPNSALTLISSSFLSSSPGLLLRCFLRLDPLVAIHGCYDDPLVPSYNRRGRDSDDPPVSAIDIAAASDSDVHTPPTIFSDMNAANFDQYGLLSHQHASHHHPQQPHHQFNSALAHSGAQGDDIFIARQTLRHAADSCDAFVKVVARQNPNVAALVLAQQGNVSSAGGASVPSTFDFLNNIANGSHAVSTAGAETAAAAGTGGANGKEAKKLSKLQKRKEKRLRDPDAPKRPPSAYLLFQNEVRQEIRKKHPGLPYSSVLRKVSEAWKELTDEQQKVYHDKTTENMVTWNQQKKEHEANMNPISLDA